MLITRISPITNKEITKDLNITQAQLDRWQNGELIQNVMPHLTPDDREFLITGMLPNEWDELFKDDDEDN